MNHVELDFCLGIYTHAQWVNTWHSHEGKKQRADCEKKQAHERSLVVAVCVDVNPT